MASRGGSIVLLVLCLIGMGMVPYAVCFSTSEKPISYVNDVNDVNVHEFRGFQSTAAHLSCRCGSLTSRVKKPLNETSFQRIYREMNSSDADLGVISEVMGTEDCKDCKVVYVTCYVLPTWKLVCFKEPDLVARLDEEPEEIKIKLCRQQSGRREKRQVGGSCSFPASMDTAVGFCRRHPSFVKCVQLCIYGYAVDGGISKKLQCKFEENKWEPSGFKECQPFVDCTTSLVSPGALNCTPASMTDAPQCKIECLRYEDKEAVPEDVYTCRIDGTWEPPLPFCAAPKSGLVLVKAPSKKTHGYLMNKGAEQEGSK